MAPLAVTLWLVSGLVMGAPGVEGNAPFPIPPTYALVNDYHGILTLRQQRELGEKLYALEKKNGTQIVVLIVPTTGDVPNREYAQQVFDKWDIGNNADGNGALFLYSGYQGQISIVTGPGIAGALPDIKVRHIFYEHLAPHFQKQDWFGGIDETVDALVAAAHGEETASAQYPEFVVEITRDMLIAALLALAGLGYAGFYGWKWYRRRQLTRENEHA